MRRLKDRFILSFVAVGTLVAMMAMQSGRKINPIGWFDFNQDNIRDALVIEPTDNKHAQIGFIDGNSVYKSYNNQFWTKAPFQRFDLPPINYDSGMIYSGIIGENRKNYLNLRINMRYKESNLESSVGIYENLSLIRH